jgi:hypothetical protein
MVATEEKLFSNQTIEAENMTPTIQDSSGQKMRTLNNEKGQSAVEFILTFAFALGLTFLFVNQAINLTAGYLNHYVNFMASRTYLVHEVGVDNKSSGISAARAEAIKVFKSYPIKKFGVDATFEVLTSDQGSGLFNGTIAKFKRPLSSLPVVGAGEDALFYSESFLGKEPLRITCAEMVCAAMTGSRSECRASGDDIDIVLYDNGC